MIPEETQGATKVSDAVHEHRPAPSELVRGGRPDSRILLILIFSAGAAAVLLLGMWFLSNGGFASQNPNNGQQAVDAQAFRSNAPAAAPATAPAPAPASPAQGPAGDPLIAQTATPEK